MNREQELVDLLDNYIKGKLNAEEISAFENKMLNDADFRQKAEQHFTLAKELKFYGEQSKLRSLLDDVHSEMESPVKTIELEVASSKNWKKYWAISAVAAAVALISVVGTFFFTSSLQDQQETIYKELSRDMNRLKKSQKIMMDNIAEKKEKKPAKSLGNYAGTGFLISANGYLTTSYHVVRESDSVYIENERFGRLKAVVVHNDPVNDVSILKIEGTLDLKNSTLPFTLAKTEASLAEDVYTLGFPREDVVFGAGSISALTGYKENPNAYQVSVPVNPGNSGGPLLNNKGDLVGIISGVETQTAGVAFATKSTVLLDVISNDVLDSLKKPLLLSRQNTMKNTSRVEQVKRWKDFVFMVRVFKN